MKYISISNNQAVSLDSIPELPYEEFLESNIGMLTDSPERHCVNYFGFWTEAYSSGEPVEDLYDENKNRKEYSENVKLICCIADDKTHQIYVSSATVAPEVVYESFTARNHNFEKYEREMHEIFGIQYNNHPWLKPVRYSHDRADKAETVENYPFFGADSHELHEVGVGPIHAGIIEPGHFRFICNGEQIMHLEIQLGYQHRGIEQLFLQKKKLAELTTLAENIAGDTTVGHTVAFVNLWESLCGYKPGRSLHFSRTLALELERIAIHTGDMSAVCADIGYQLGNSVYGRLRTPIINFLQEWGGNRLAKGLIRAGRTNFPFSRKLGARLASILDEFELDFNEMTSKFFKLPSALSRLEKTGVVTYGQVLEIGTVGMAARMSGLNRDIRSSHPFNLFGEGFTHEPVIKHHGDVYARVRLRRDEIHQSIGYIRKMIADIPEFTEVAGVKLNPQRNMFILSLVEGWRGEICHCAITDNEGSLGLYKIKDPSFHNWMALAQAVRNNGISDFPICNKSFNLSYCGHDL